MHSSLEPPPPPPPATRSHPDPATPPCTAAAAACADPSLSNKRRGCPRVPASHAAQHVGPQPHARQRPNGVAQRRGQDARHDLRKKRWPRGGGGEGGELGRQGGGRAGLGLGGAGRSVWVGIRSVGQGGCLGHCLGRVGKRRPPMRITPGCWGAWAGWGSAVPMRTTLAWRLWARSR